MGHLRIFKEQGGRVFAPPPLIGTSLNTLGVISSIPDDYCHLETPWLTQAKFIASFRLPWQDIGISATIQSTPGGSYNANYAVPNASISGLTNPATGAARNPNAALSANLLPPGSAYNDRINQVDMKFTKNFRMANQRSVRAAVGLYNAFNSNALTGVSSTFNAANWQKATSILSTIPEVRSAVRSSAAVLRDPPGHRARRHLFQFFESAAEARNAAGFACFAESSSSVGYAYSPFLLCDAFQ